MRVLFILRAVLRLVSDLLWIILMLFVAVVAVLAKAVDVIDQRRDTLYLRSLYLRAKETK